MKILHHKIVLVLILWFSLSWQACNGDRLQVGNGTKGTADKILIDKSAHVMSLMSRSHVLRTYRVAIGRSPVGAKTRTGDHKTPEGEYVIDSKKSNSRFHLALHVSYPNQADLERAHLLGVNPGGDIEIHGLQNGLGWIGSGHRIFDWTDGCIAVTDTEIGEIWDLVPVGTPVLIRP